MDNFNKTKRLLREGFGDVQTSFTDAMIDIKKNNPNLTHTEVMELLKTEFDRFFKLHTDRMDFPKIPGNLKDTKFRDYMPTRTIPYGQKKKKG
jgi:hypothetical protein